MQTFFNTYCCKAINYTVNWKGENGEKVRIIHLSLGTKNPNPELHKAIKEAIKNNINTPKWVYGIYKRNVGVKRQKSLYKISVTKR